MVNLTLSAGNGNSETKAIFGFIVKKNEEKLSVALWNGIIKKGMIFSIDEARQINKYLSESLQEIDNKKAG